jgi:hypothetical protein
MDLHAGTNEENMGSPIKGLVKRKNTPQKEKTCCGVQQVPIRLGGLLPTPIMVQCRTQTDYANNLSSSKAT